MMRSFSGEPVSHDLLDRLCTEALRAPTAGNVAGVRMTTAVAGQVAEYFSVATDPTWRASSARFAGLSRAGGVVVVTSRPQDYFARYAEPDKVDSGLSQLGAWIVPYWHTDAAMATMTLLLLIEEHGLGAVLWGNFRHEAEVVTWARAEGESLFATVLVGGAAPEGDAPSRSLSRAVPPRRERVRRVPPDDTGRRDSPQG